MDIGPNLLNWPYEADLEHSHILRAARDDWFLLIESATFFYRHGKDKGTNGMLLNG